MYKVIWYLAQEWFIALQPSRVWLGIPLQKTCIATMELRCKKIQLGIGMKVKINKLAFIANAVRDC